MFTFSTPPVVVALTPAQRADRLAASLRRLADAARDAS
jgi:hypothetical protein